MIQRELSPDRFFFLFCGWSARWPWYLWFHVCPWHAVTSVECILEPTVICWLFLVCSEHQTLTLVPSLTSYPLLVLFVQQFAPMLALRSLSSTFILPLIILVSLSFFLLCDVFSPVLTSHFTVSISCDVDSRPRFGPHVAFTLATVLSFFSVSFA